MKRIEITLTETAREVLQTLSTQGVSSVRELTRAQIFFEGAARLFVLNEQQSPIAVQIPVAEFEPSERFWRTMV
jgi:hypothetical protein